MPQVIRCPNAARRCRCPTARPASRSTVPAARRLFAVGAGPGPSGPRSRSARGRHVAGSARRRRRAAGRRRPKLPAPTRCRPAAAGGTPKECPACSRRCCPAPSPAWIAATCSRPTPAAAEADGPPNLCTNPACGVANPPGERNCQRCGNAAADRRRHHAARPLPHRQAAGDGRLRRRLPGHRHQGRQPARSPSRT